MDPDMVMIYIFIVGVYILIGLLLSSIVGSVMGVELEKYVLATLLFWPLVLVIGAILQLIRFVKIMFKGDY